MLLCKGLLDVFPALTFYYTMCVGFPDSKLRHKRTNRDSLSMECTELKHFSLRKFRVFVGLSQALFWMATHPVIIATRDSFWIQVRPVIIITQNAMRGLWGHGWLTFPMPYRHTPLSYRVLKVISLRASE